MQSCDLSLVTSSFLWEKLSWPQFYKNLTRETNFWTVLVVRVQYFGTAARYGLEILRKCGKKIGTKSQKVSVLLTANFYICRSYKEKTGRGPFCPPSWIGKNSSINISCNTFFSVFSLTNSKPSVLLFNNFFHWSFPWKVKKENR